MPNGRRAGKMGGVMCPILLAQVWTPWPWASFALALCLLVGLGVLLAGVIRRSAFQIAVAIVLMLLTGAVHMVIIEHAAARQQQPAASRPAASRPADAAADGATP